MIEKELRGYDIINHPSNTTFALMLAEAGEKE